MINTSKQMERDGARWGKKSPSQSSKMEQTNDAIFLFQRADQSSSGMLKPEKS
jgi:hypothetical protein